MSEKEVYVLILATGQPQNPHGKLVNLREIQELATLLSTTYHIKIDRKFGLLEKDFSATVKEKDLKLLHGEPGVEAITPIRTYQPVMESAVGDT